jgi:DNA repair exonuclease SbcCD ATPase subunit
MAEAVKDANAVVMDPFRKVPTASQTEKAAEDEKELVKPLRTDTDLPEGLKVEPEVFAKVNQLRLSKIESEIALKKLTTSLNESTSDLRSVETASDRNNAELTSIRQQISSTREKLLQDSWDVSLMINMKQGQDEVYCSSSLQKPIEAMLVHRGVIENENQDIRVKGADKIKVLNKIVAYRKNINVMDWEHKYIEAKASNLEEHYTDLHMLRVTKNLQEFLKGSTRDKNKKEMVQLERKLKYLQNSIKQKQQNMQKKLRRHEKQLNDRYTESQKLESQQKAIAQRVVQLEAVNRTRVNQESSADIAKNRMKNIVTRRKLVDLARAQTDEIEFLRQELDRLRQKTFPSFAHSRRAELARMGNPDEMY